MKDGFVTAAAVTPRLKVADVDYNTREICDKILECSDEGAKIIVFPELCVTGASCGDLFLQDALIKAADNALNEIAQMTEETDALVFVGLPMKIRGKLYNAAAALSNGALIGVTVKSNAGRIGAEQESRWFADGDMKDETFERNGQFIPVGRRLVFACEQVPDLTLAAVIGDDAALAYSPDISAAAKGAVLICHLAADPALAGHFRQRREDLTARTGKLHTGWIYANAGADESTTDQVFGGHSMICENGNVLAASDAFAHDIIYSEIDASILAHEQRQLQTGRSRHCAHRPEPVSFSLITEETVLTRQYPRLPFVPENEKEREERCSEVLAIQTYGLAKRLKHIGAKSVILGLSGGLDSTLAILVCAQTFDLMKIPRRQITAVTMPCFGTTGRTYRNACDLARALGATLKEIPIADAVRQHFRDIGHDEDVHDAAYENSQARERTQILMDIANQTGALHVGTGDLSELALGWATYNGDHMSMYDVNGSVPKTLMRHIVRYIADQASSVEEETGELRNEALAEVLNDILDTPISPELLPPTEGGQISQSTEDLVGPYELHDFFIYHVMRYGFAPGKLYRIAEETFDGVYEPEIVLKWLKNFYRRFFSQQFKRSCMSDGPQVGTVDLSPRGSWAMPSDACSALWLKELELL
ncbi:MAG: NAD(+) synthase [Lachnospiraceae bacterium]|nr:NAD(+) synthase [Lachnospiraceae bacterium]